MRFATRLNPRALAAGTLLILALGAALLLNPEAGGVRQLSGPTMGTSWSLKLAQPLDAERAEGLQERLAAILEQVNDQMSTWREDSELSRFNRSTGDDWFAVSPATAEVVSAALAVSRLTDGAFDVTVGPLVNLWGFGPDFPVRALPADEEIAATLERVGYRQLEVRLDPPALRKRLPELYVDLSAIAKGYAVDRLAQELEDSGIGDFLVEVGGELKGHGHNERGQPWQVAVERPNAGTREVERLIPLSDRGIATSGDYRNFFELDGVRYSHSIDPRTGRPVPHELASATVVDASTMRADALATALIVMGPERAEAFARQQGLAVLLIRRHEGAMALHPSPALEDYLATGESS